MIKDDFEALQKELSNTHNRNEYLNLVKKELHDTVEILIRLGYDVNAISGFAEDQQIMPNHSTVVEYLKDVFFLYNGLKTGIWPLEDKKRDHWEYYRRVQERAIYEFNNCCFD